MKKNVVEFFFSCYGHTDMGFRFFKLILKLETQHDSGSIVLTTSMSGTTKVWKHIRVIFACS